MWRPRAVIADFGQVQPFVNVVTAEERHSAAIGLPADVRQVFSNNRSASLVNHLPAFERCS